ncbi:hypothetical protein R3751_07560 [Halorubrum distributum]|uniref:hypothetical protein n=1 Tax=Halorubrum distributum TaxID=29283 RepID=UPI0029530432|nr:hypothetical protein [Halorubrum distributum]MDV7349632.1 hypothetical protein [Halorubrum distributum]
MTTPTLDLETTVTRDHPVTQTPAAIQIDRDEFDESVVRLAFSGQWGTTYVTLTATEARTIASALEKTATDAANAEATDE